MSSPSLSPPPEHECHPYSSSSLRWSSLAITAAAWISVTPGGFIINSCVSTTIAKNITSLFGLAKPSTVSSPSSSTFTRTTDTWRGNVHIQSFLGQTAFLSMIFLSDLCAHGVLSLDRLVCLSVRPSTFLVETLWRPSEDYQCWVELSWWPNFQLMQVAPPVGHISN